MNTFSGKVAVITGAASGIGRELALQLAEQNCALALLDKNEDALKQTQEAVLRLVDDCQIYAIDVGDAESMKQCAEKVDAHFGRVDVLINNAGVSLIASAGEQKLEDFHWLMNINFWGVVHGVQAFLPYLRQSDSAHIVNVSSLFGLLSLPLQSAYNASKYAVKGYTESLKMEMAGTNVHVSCVHPGGIKTDITRNLRVGNAPATVTKEQLVKDFDKLAKTSAKDAASAILNGMAKHKRRILIGADAKILDVVNRLFPGRYEKLLGFEKSVINSRNARLKAEADQDKS
jgi:butyryl-CoA dehydrogenase